MIDSLPLWFWLPTAIILWSILGGLFIASVFRAEPDPYPDDLSRLDRLDRNGAS